MTDLATWLLAQIADDEQEARQVSVKAPAPWKVSEYNEIADVNGKGIVTSGDYGSPWMQDYVDDHIARWDPARVLAECDAKRRIVARHSDTYTGDNGYQWCRRDDDHVPCWDLRDLATPYADRPGYLDEWRPNP